MERDNWVIQISKKRGEDMLNVRGNTVSEFTDVLHEVEELLPDFFKPSTPQAFQATQGATQRCLKCGSEMKVSAKSGKPYCSALCWKNKEDLPF